MAMELASGPDFGRILIGKTSKAVLRPVKGRRADFEALPMRIRPTSGPEARFPARKPYCVLWGTVADRSGGQSFGGLVLLDLSEPGPANHPIGITKRSLAP